MSRWVKQYRRRVVSLLLCSRARKKQLLSEIDRCMEAVLQDIPGAAEADLRSALGSPREFAETLLEDVPAEERAAAEQTAQKKKTIAIIGAVVGVCAIVALIIYVLYLRKYGWVIEQQTIIYQ